MQFNSYRTTYSEFKRRAKELGERRPSDKELPWYENVLSDKINRIALLQGIPDGVQGNTITMLRGEHNWLLTGEPYYKVFPGMASMMSEISIDIPISEFELPYETFVILLANDNSNDFWEHIKEPDSFKYKQGPRLKSILVHRIEVVRPKDTDHYQLFDPKRHKSEDKSYGLYLDYEFEESVPGESNKLNYTLSLDTQFETIEKFFEVSYENSARWYATVYQVKPGEYAPSKLMIQRIIKLVVATAFFGVDRHEVVLPDLPRRKVEQRIKKNDGDLTATKKQIRDEQSDTKSWTIGQEIYLPKPIADRREPGEHSGGGHSHAYIRRGHMRWQACGEGRKKRKLIFIHPGTCAGMIYQLHQEWVIEFLTSI